MVKFILARVLILLVDGLVIRVNLKKENMIQNYIELWKNMA